MDSRNLYQLKNLFVWPLPSQLPLLPIMIDLINPINSGVKPVFVPKVLYSSDNEKIISALQTHAQSDNKSLSCMLCCKMFKNHKGLRQHHGKIHQTFEKIHECTICTKKFNTKFAVKFHIEQVHQENKKVKCSSCELVLYNKYAFERHKKRAHFSECLI